MLSSPKIEIIAQLEPLLVLSGLVLVSILVYRVFLRGLSADRHQLLRRLFKNLFGHGIALLALYAVFRVAGSILDVDNAVVSVVDAKLYPYIGFLCILWGAIVLVKVARIFAFEYLFFVSRKAGVPVLLVNILSLALSIGLASWIATEVFGVRLAPVLATSALISVILGLAIQDTLGNLFAGVALQFDKPYEIGDWVEIQNSGQKWIGQIQEITWRSTVLIGLLDELITIPNRVVAQSEVATWGAAGKPFWRGLSYRIPFGQSIEQVKATLFQAVSRVPGVLSAPKPNIYLNEIGDSWMNFRVVFCIENYATQFLIVDQVNSAVMDAFASSGIPVATPAMRVEMLEAK